jgi:hypothetical protein
MPTRRQFLAAGAAALAGCNMPTASTETIDVSGSVTDRIGGKHVDTAITFSGLDGSVARGLVNGGSYSIDGIKAGIYDVEINGNHVPHVTRYANITGDRNFSVIAWNSSMYGVTYNEEYDRFFNQTARVDEYKKIRWVKKWREVPKKIYVVNENMGSDDFGRFMNMLDYVNENTVSDMFGGRVKKLPVEAGPPMEKYPAGTIDIRFDRFDRPAEGGIIGGTGATFLDGYSIIRAEPVFNYEYFQRRNNTNQQTTVIAHEMYHCAGANHATLFPESMMCNGGIDKPMLDRTDKLAAMLIYHDDTHPGNIYPDTNNGADFSYAAEKPLQQCAAMVTDNGIQYDILPMGKIPRIE